MKKKFTCLQKVLSNNLFFNGRNNLNKMNMFNELDSFSDRTSA